ncbi:MAG: 2-hydroxyacid dehydrogenase, partial [Candidatus Methanofastidiosia archaeon]
MKVFVTRRLPEKALRILEREVDVEVNASDRVLSKKELIKGVKDADGLLCLLTDDVDKDVISSSNLKIISNYAVGYNNIDLKKATERGIPVTNTPGVLTETTADFTFALILSLARRIVEGDRFLRNLKFKGWAPLLLLGTDVFRKTLGIVGLGRIGSGVARRAMGFSMRIIYYQRRRNKRLEEKLGAEYLEFSELLKISDFITLHIP